MGFFFSPSWQTSWQLSMFHLTDGGGGRRTAGLVDDFHTAVSKELPSTGNMAFDNCHGVLVCTRGALITGRSDGSDTRQLTLRVWVARRRVGNRGTLGKQSDGAQAALKKKQKLIGSSNNCRDAKTSDCCLKNCYFLSGTPRNQWQPLLTFTLAFRSGLEIAAHQWFIHLFIYLDRWGEHKQITCHILQDFAVLSLSNSVFCWIHCFCCASVTSRWHLPWSDVWVLLIGPLSLVPMSAGKAVAGGLV